MGRDTAELSDAQTQTRIWSYQKFSESGDERAQTRKSLILDLGLDTLGYRDIVSSQEVVVYWYSTAGNSLKMIESRSGESYLDKKWYTGTLQREIH